jgi:hypothetical protein
MATYICCPHCDKALRVPEGCGGRPTRCPNCQQPLLIPGVSDSHDQAFVCAVIAPEAGTVTAADVEQALAESERLSVLHADTATQLARLQRGRQRERALMSLTRFRLTARHELDHSLGRTGGFFIAISLGAAVMLLLASLLHPSFVGYLIAAAIGLCLTVVLYVPLAVVPDDDALRPAVDEHERNVAKITSHVDQLAAEERRLGSERAAAQREYQRLRAAIESRLHYLRTCRWQTMTGKEFEQFLVQVFQERGYRVEHIGNVGDQGVDLILARDQHRIAVQAKGYVGQAVGNDAVQQAHTGSAYHRCQSAAVVTNARFTFAARALAERIGCRLIDGDEMNDLIDGRVLL